MTRKAPNPVDVHVGSRVRLRRILIDMSQEKLADQLGITFQQVQKYEKGTNRIGASRLYRIAQVLAVPVGFFFDDLPGTAPVAPGFAEGDDQSYIVEFISSTEGVQLNKAFMRIGDTRVRRKFVELVQALAAED